MNELNRLKKAESSSREDAKFPVEENDGLGPGRSIIDEVGLPFSGFKERILKRYGKEEKHTWRGDEAHAPQ